MRADLVDGGPDHKSTTRICIDFSSENVLGARAKLMQQLGVSMQMARLQNIIRIVKVSHTVAATAACA